MNSAARPRLAPDAVFHPVGNEGVLLVTESEGILSLKGSIWPRLLPVLDGTKTVSQLTTTLKSPADVFELYRALFLLKGRGLVEEGPAPDDPASRFWKAPASRKVCVSVECAGGADSAVLEQVLSISGIAVDKSADVAVIITTDYRCPSLADINRRQLKSGRPWLLVKADGWRPSIGPVFTPGAGPCWDCLASRLKVNQTELEYVESLSAGSAGVRSAAGSTAATRMLIAVAAPILERVCLTGTAGELANAIWMFDLNTMAHETHHVVRRPQCPVCGNPELAGGSAEIRLQARPKRFTDSGGFRTESPWLTYERYRRHVSPVSGAVSELKPGLLDENPFHLFSSGTNRVTPIRGTRDLMAFSLRGKSGGKGATREQAVAGALAEALERYSCSWRGDGRAVRARMSDLEGAVDPRTILNYSQAQYAARDEINARGERCYLVPHPFDPEEVIEWTPVWSLAHARRRFVPTALCWFGYVASFAWADSNGCAAGNNLEEAILQGLCELVERDATSMWWYNQIPRPAIDLDSLDDAWCQSMRRTFHERYGRLVTAIDLTHDIGISVAAVVCGLEDAESPEFFFGLGAHLDPAIAVRRAFTEMCQFFGSLTAWAGETQGRFATVCRNMDPGMARWLSSATIVNQPQMTPVGPARKVRDLPAYRSETLLEDIQIVVSRLQALGLEALALDCTQPDVGMPVARVFVPGLRHFWARFSPGRLYDVPLKLGWLTEARRECDLNPIPMFF